MRLACGVALVVCMGTPARAQETRQAADTVRARCDSVLRASVADSQRVLVRSFLARRDGQPLEKNDGGMILQEFGAHLRLPRPMRLPVFSPGPAQMRSLRLLRTGDTTLRLPLIDATIQFLMLRNGTASHIEVTHPSLIPGFDSAAIASLRQMSEEKLFPLVSDEALSETIPLNLRLTSAADGVGIELPLFASFFPKLRVTDAILREPAPTPVYPKDERSVGAEGDVLFQVVVNSDGEPELETLELMHASTRGFAVAAFEAVRQMRWTPAHVDSCSVPQVVSVPIRFTLRPAHSDSTAKPLTSP